ncbi:MAG: methionine adenosyltransferase [Bacteroidales bacterium]|nr:methionine adenosyltransferase [Bacteroidales bacterium]MDD2322353.1 methionine adenosyltransferase [Bacteroidales bacterium]MDD3009844.1 methionine adenosyltransferase [Bacteroidales bacterium]MDD3960941.1 methionine adenosyltransferase [Bacteroidales bacterium]MDY0285599.1 methionine adenosyltransferase [Bacteroidales bacterium]
MGFLFTSESVSEGHPDKVADQISDALLDEFLRHDKSSKVACETLATTGLVMCSGEVRTNGYVEIQHIVRETIRKIGYTKASYRFDADSCGVISTLHEQSADIHQGVVRASEEEQGAGDQGIMFGYACREMDNLMPLPIELAHILLQELAEIRKEGEHMTYLAPDSKSQVTVEYDDNGNPVRIDTIVISTQHDEFRKPEDKTKEAQLATDKLMHDKICRDIKEYLLPRVEKKLPERIRKMNLRDARLLVNPTGKFVIGGPHGDTGLTGRKIIVDTYGGFSSHGGGAFSGKDSSKVDRSAAYAARHIAKNLVAAGVADKVQIQIAYAIGVAEPVGIYINTYNTNKTQYTDDQIAEKLLKIYDLRPYAIIKRFGLTNPIFLPTASYGHFGRDSYEKEVEVYFQDNDTYTLANEERYFKKVTFFGWEKNDYAECFREAFI